MQSTFSGIELAKRSLQANTLSLQTIGQNISNASTDGYSRQRVELVPTSPIYRPQLNRAETAGQIGQGVETERIERIRDTLLEGRIVGATASEGYWENRSKYLEQIEQVYNEPNGGSLRTAMDGFWDAWQELSLFPEQTASRLSVIERGQTLVDGITTRFQSLSMIQTIVDDEIGIAVEQINELTTRIAQLNNEIVRSQAAGDNPNDLMDRRDLLVEDLGTYIPITVETRDGDEYSVFTGGLHIVQGSFARSLTLSEQPGETGFHNVQWDDNGREFRPASGSLGAFLELRDTDLREEIQNLDNMAVNFIDLVNEVHRHGYELTGNTGTDFFVQLPFVLNAQGNFDRSGDGTFDSSFIFRVTGTNGLSLQDQVGIEGTMLLPGADGPISVEYHATDTVQDILVRVNNSGAEIAFRLDYENRLTVKATPAERSDRPDFILRDFSDSGQFLAGYAGILAQPGHENGYVWEQANAVDGLRDGVAWAVGPETHPSGWLAINPEIVENPNAIATSIGGQTQPGEVGDGRIALEIAAIRNSPVMIGQISTFDDYFADTIASIALRGQQAEIAVDTNSLIMNDLRTLRESISGVNIDEELANMIKFQQGYNAAAKFLSMWNDLLDTVINRLGV